MVVEVNTSFQKATDSVDMGDKILMFTPPIGGNYWLFRVQLKYGQSIVAFPKFGTIGCGFAVEKDDWNTNLPIQCSAEKIYGHIAVNKGHKNITKASCLQAIRAIQRIAIPLLEKSLDRNGGK